jgi:intracellular multiplication protein IcmD
VGTILKRFLICGALLLALISAASYADVPPVIYQAPAMSVGDAASSLMGPMGLLKKIMNDICLIAGVAFLLGALLQYRAHRENPSQVRLSTPFFMLILSLAFFGLPYVHQLANLHPSSISV